MATRESSLTIAACFRRILLSPTAFHGTLQHFYPCLSFVLFLFLFSALCFRCTPQASSCIPLLLFHSHLFSGTSYISLPPSCPLFPVALFPNLHSIPLLSSLHSTPKYCNFSLVATTALQLRNDKFLARLPCLVPPFLSSASPYRTVLVPPATTSCFQRG